MKILIALLVVVALGLVTFLVWLRTKPGAAPRKQFAPEEHERYDELKMKALERVLGPTHELVGHALIPFALGGTVDMYYFPNAIPGTGFATMELIDPDGTGPKPNEIGTYELVAFTRHKMPEPSDKSEDNPFNKIERRMCGIFTGIGYYSRDAVLKPKDTCEIPDEDNSNICLIFDEYKPDGREFTIDGRKHCLLLCIEVFRSEMEHAMKNGSAVVIEKLKERGHYPYSDLDREPVF